MRRARHRRPCGGDRLLPRRSKIDFVVVGPEAPLVRRHRRRSRSRRHQGVRADQVRRRGWKAPRASPRTCARPTTSRPPPMSASRGAAPAKAYVREQGAPIVVKADGLAAGKGVVVAETRGRGGSRHRHDVRRRARRGRRWEIVIEEFLVGEEASFFALCDGETAIALASAQDHKRVGDGDTGPNTGGMGAYSPAPVMTRADERARDGRDRPADACARMKAMGAPLQGRAVRRADDHRARARKLIEYNVRFGDPEMPGADAAADVGPAAGADRRARRAAEELRSALVSRDAALTVVMAAKGYPGALRARAR